MRTLLIIALRSSTSLPAIPFGLDTYSATNSDCNRLGSAFAQRVEDIFQMFFRSEGFASLR
jgi:hypothetical protein